MPFPTRFSGSTLLAGPKHSTSVPSSTLVALTLSVDVKEVAFVPNPVPGVALKTLPGPQTEVEVDDRCTRGHSLLPPTLQTVVSLLPLVTVQVKLKISLGQVGGAAANWPTTSPGGYYIKNFWSNY